MIPKIIHYCWFGRGQLPELAQKCIASWKKFLPDYEIREWNEDNFDVNIIPYTAEAYAQKKYAFVSDYARFWILYKYGGIYFDTDVEVIRPMDDIIAKGNFMGFETNPNIEKGNTGSVGLGLGFGLNPKNNFIKQMLDRYDGLHFEYVPGGIGQLTIVHITTEILISAGLKICDGIQYVGDIWIYPAVYFCPIDLRTGRIHVKENTRTIHHYAGTWKDHNFSIKSLLKRILPENVLLKLMCLKSKK